ncbi:hypothetical protein BH23VER1_BH23VER1_37700 [soil metagenome]
MLGAAQLRAAVGYMELGMLEDAWAELDGIPEPILESEAGVHLRLLLLLREERWDKGLAMAVRLCALTPGMPTGFIHGAYCLHEMGRTEEAQQTLLEGPDSLRQEPIFFYNLACYKAALGEEADAEAFLRKSILMDDRLHQVALKDPDLKALWERI